MKKLSLFTALAAILSFSSCEDDAILGCMDETATNYNSNATQDDSSCLFSVLGCTDEAATNYDELATEDDDSCEYPTNAELIIGTWDVDSAEVRAFLPQNILDIMILASTMMSPEEFFEEFNFPMPTTESEWDIITTEGIPMDTEDFTGSVIIDTENINLDLMNDPIESTYVVSDDTIIELISNPDEMDYFTIVEVDETNLTLATTVSDDGITVNLTLYLSK